MKNSSDLAEWDEGTVELSIGANTRLILNTVHGQIIIDMRRNDVNSFVFVDGERKDVVLLHSVRPIAT